MKRICLLPTLVALASSKKCDDLDFEDVSNLLSSFIRVDEPDTAKLGGAAWLDYDNDGDLDLYLVNSPGGNNALFRNDGGQFTDVAAEAGVTGGQIGHTGVLAFDYNNNGCTDLFLTGAGGFFGVGLPSLLYRNNCDGTFTDVTVDSGIDKDHVSLMAAAGDIDGDGYVDLFVASPGVFYTGVLTPQKLYHNDGDGTFTDISASAGIDTTLGACVVSFFDFNGDLLPDILVGNCNNLNATGFPIVGPWELWINQGDLTFVNKADEAGLNVRPGFPMAITIADVNRDGCFDFFATGMGPINPFEPGLLGEQVLFMNSCEGSFSDATYESGLGGFGFGWGASFADFDNDGNNDLVTVGSVAVDLMQFIGPLASPGKVFRNDGDGHFEVKVDFGLQDQATSGLAVADVDNDGYPDIVIVKTEFSLEDPAQGGGPIQGDGTPVLMRNKGNCNNSITLRLVGTQSNRGAIGAVVEVPTESGRQIKTVMAGSSFASTDSPWLIFGLGKQKSATIKVQWPSGHKERFHATASSNLKTLEEGKGISMGG